MVHTIRTVSELRRLLPQFDWQTLEYDQSGTMRVSDSVGQTVYQVEEAIWRSPSSPLNRGNYQHASA